MTRRLGLLFGAILFLLAGTPARAQEDGERILAFQSAIAVQGDGSLLVTETIRVQATGDQIQHGIYRDFPTSYEGSYGLKTQVAFHVLSVMRDGSTDGYHLQDLANGVRVYLGKKEVTLDPGIYTYTLRYLTDQQIGFFKDHDELYWNVTGNGWIFPIDQATAYVTLPPEVPRDKMTLEAYTGGQGSKAKNYRASLNDVGQAVYTTTAALRPHEGLTLVLTWPKGFFTEPTVSQKRERLLLANPSPVIAIFGSLLVLAYFTMAWFRVGRDPPAGTIIPLYAPPENLSPASVRFIHRMGYDDKCFASALINMAVQGFLKIKDIAGTYTLTHQKDQGRAGLASDEQSIAEKFFGSANSLTLSQSNHSKISSAISAFKEELKTRYERIYFFKHLGYFAVGFALSLGVLAIAFALEPATAGANFFLIFWLMGWSVGCSVLIWQAKAAWQKALVSQGGLKKTEGCLGAILPTLFAVIFSLGEVTGLVALFRNASPGIIASLLFLVPCNIIFLYLLRAPTIPGQALLDKIEGFKMYLGTAEAERLNLENPPERTPELFEKFLPYALALGVEQAWSQKFSEVLSRAKLGDEGVAYQPLWYSGNFNASSFAGALGNTLSTAVSSSSTAPGSSSGSGGGGFSGGGGGGGGGGGW